MMSKPQFLFPRLVTEISVYKQDDLYDPFDHVCKYVNEHFPAYVKLLQELNDAWDDMMETCDEGIDYIEVENHHYEYSHYLADIQQFFFYQGASAALHEYMGLQSSPEQLMAQINSELGTFLQSDYMAARRRGALEGLARAAALTKHPDTNRRYRIALLKRRLSCCYLDVIAGYEQEVAQFIAFDQAYPVKQDFLQGLHQLFDRLYIDLPDALLDL